MCGLIADTGGELEAHVETHFLTPKRPQADGAARDASDEPVLICDHPGCGARVPLGQVDAHEQQHDHDLALRLSEADGPAGAAYRARASSTAQQLSSDATLAEQLAREAAMAEDRALAAALACEDAPAAAVARPLSPPVAAGPDFPPDENSQMHGLLPMLRAALQQQARRAPASERARVIVVSGDAPLYRQVRTDSGWSCGYRNIQSLCSFLAASPAYTAAALFAGTGPRHVPTVAGIQYHIEQAWRGGYDVMGAAQLGHQLQGTRTWIGAVECAALLRSWHVRARLIDFGSELQTRDRQQRRLAPLPAAAAPPPLATTPHVQLAEWVWRYFATPVQAGVGARSDAEVEASARAPLYFQHDGHSRLIVGVERRWHGGTAETNLLVFDPGRPSAEYRAALDRSAHDTQWAVLWKRSVKSLKMREYQLVACDGVMASAAERHASRTLVSERPPP